MEKVTIKEGLPKEFEEVFFKAKTASGEKLFVGSYFKSSNSFITRGSNQHDNHHELNSIVYWLRETKAENISSNLPVSRSKFIVKIDDGFCEWEYGFSLKRDTCIKDYVNAIEKGMKAKKDYSKLVR